MHHPHVYAFSGIETYSTITMMITIVYRQKKSATRKREIAHGRNFLHSDLSSAGLYVTYVATVFSKNSARRHRKSRVFARDADNPRRGRDGKKRNYHEGKKERDRGGGGEEIERRGREIAP